MGREARDEREER
jgi:hypothetical protein